MEDLKEFIERSIDEMMKELGFKLIEPEKEKNKEITIKETITFLKGESARKATEFFNKRENSPFTSKGNSGEV